MFTNKANNGRYNLCGSIIALRRKKLGKSQRELADLLQIEGLDIDKNAVQRIEAGKRFVTDVELVYFANVLNMTFDEAYQTMASGEPLAVFGMFSGEGTINAYGFTNFIGTLAGVPCIMLIFELGNIELYWTADGISPEAPEQPK